jgi:2-haloacid dehalogenase
MDLDRRTFVQTLAVGAALAASAGHSALAQGAKIKAVAFDAYGTLFDVYSVGQLAEKLFPGQGNAISQLWRTKQIEYTWLRAMSGQYRTFWEVTEDGLVFTAQRLGLDLTDDKKRALMEQYNKLDPFPENLEVLKQLKGMGVRMAILSNGNPPMLEAAVKSARMEGLFEALLSVDSVKSFKTVPEVYRLGPDHFKLSAPEIVFVSSNGWDAAGATWFGYTTFWVNRAGNPTEVLGVRPVAEGKTLTDLVEFVKARL